MLEILLNIYRESRLKVRIVHSFCFKLGRIIKIYAEVVTLEAS